MKNKLLKGAVILLPLSFCTQYTQADVKDRIRGEISSFTIIGDSLLAEKQGNKRIHDIINKFTNGEDYKNKDLVDWKIGQIPIKSQYVDRLGKYTWTFSNSKRMYMGHVATKLGYDLSDQKQYHNIAVGGAMVDDQGIANNDYIIYEYVHDKFKIDKIGKWDNRLYQTLDLWANKGFKLHEKDYLREDGYFVHKNKHGHYIVRKYDSTKISSIDGLTVTLNKDHSYKAKTRDGQSIDGKLKIETVKKNKDGSYSVYKDNKKLGSFHDPMILKKGGYFTSHKPLINVGNNKYVDFNQKLAKVPFDGNWDKLKVKDQADFVGVKDQVEELEKSSYRPNDKTWLVHSAYGNDFIMKVAAPFGSLIAKHKKGVILWDSEVKAALKEFKPIKEEFKTYLRDNYSYNFNKLASMGYKNMVIVTLPDLEKTPVVNELGFFTRKFIGHLIGDLSVEINDEVKNFVKNNYASFKGKYGSNLYIYDLGTIFNKMLEKPHLFGLKDTKGLSYMGRGDPDTHIFYDQLHYTEIAGKIIADHKISWLDELITDHTISAYENKMTQVKNQYYSYFDRLGKAPHKRQYSKRMGTMISLSNNIFGDSDQLGLRQDSYSHLGEWSLPVTFFVDKFETKDKELGAEKEFYADQNQEFLAFNYGADVTIMPNLTLSLGISDVTNSMEFETEKDLVGSTAKINNTAFNYKVDQLNISGHFFFGEMELDRIARGKDLFDTNISGQSQAEIGSHGLNLSYAHKSDGFSIIPSIGYHHKEMVVDAFDESDELGFSRHYNAIKDESLITNLAIDASYNFNLGDITKATLSSYINYEYEHKPEGYEVSSYLHNQDWIIQTMASEKQEKNRLSFGLGLDILSYGKIKTSLDYNAHLNKLGNREDEHSLSGTFKISF